MSILDGLNNAFEKAGEGINAAAQGISEAAKNKNDKKEIKAPGKKSNFTRCPNCGQPLNGITAVCPSCGYELRNAKTSASIEELTKAIEALERKRNDILDSIAAKLSGRNNPTDEKIASVINTFIVPNTKEDIFEFMILASGNMDARILAGKKPKTVADSPNGGPSEIIVKAWANKFEQTFQKAKVTFGSDPDFKKIQDIYDKKMDDIEDEKHFFKRRK